MIALKRIFSVDRKYVWLTRAAALVAAYGAWVLAFRLLILTLVTYYLSSSGHTPRFEEISEALSANEASLYGIGALAFIALLRALNPLTSTTTEEIFTPELLEKSFLPGFLHGGVLATGIILAFLISGLYRYLGVFIQFEEASLALASVVLRVFALLAFAYCEEFIFRHKILRQLRPREEGLAGALTAAAITSAFYCLVKVIQFDLGLMQLITLFLLSLALSVGALTEGGFGRGAGFWGAILIVFQPLLSLPILGNEFSGILLIKHQLPATVEESFSTARFLAGGAGGPLSSFAFQLLLILDIVRGILRYKGRLHGRTTSSTTRHS